MPKYISGRVKTIPVTGLTSDRYRYLSLADAEPNLGDPQRYGFTSDHMLPVLVNAIKELDSENTELKQRLVAIEQHLIL